MFVDRLTREADRLREQISLYEAQLDAQREDTKAAREVVSEVDLYPFQILLLFMPMLDKMRTHYFHLIYRLIWKLKQFF